MLQGIEYEADPRQVEKLLESLDLEDAKKVATPGVKPLPEQILADTPLPAEQHTIFRALGARCNYLAADRPDIQFSAKEICRWMANPTELSMVALRKLGRFCFRRTAMFDLLDPISAA